MLAIFGSVRRSVINGVIPANAGIQQAAASRQGHNCLCNTGSPVECVAGHPRLSGPGTARMASFRPPLEREDRRAPRSEARRGGVNSQIAADVERSPHPASHLASLVARPPSPSRGGGAVRAWHRSTQRLKQLIGMSVRVLAARFASELCEQSPSSEARAQGRPGVGSHPWPACRKECRRQSPQVRAGQPAFPARWLYGLYVISPGTGLIAPVFATTLTRCADISTGMPGPHDFAVRIGSSVCVNDHAAARRAHRIPHPTLVTIARRPSHRGGMAV